MRALVQRVTEASVGVGGEKISSIQQGLLVLLGVEQDDTEEDAARLVNKVTHYRIFSDEQGKMNLNVKQIAGELLVVSQFTLAADTQQGLRPGFSRAAKPDYANHLYRHFCQLAGQDMPVQTGEFGADMKVALVNDGPVTFLLTTK